jgi:hypothetical protein
MHKFSIQFFYLVYHLKFNTFVSRSSSALLTFGTYWLIVNGKVIAGWAELWRIPQNIWPCLANKLGASRKSTFAVKLVKRLIPLEMTWHNNLKRGHPPIKS